MQGSGPCGPSSNLGSPIENLQDIHILKIACKFCLFYLIHESKLRCLANLYLWVHGSLRYETCNNLHLHNVQHKKVSFADEFWERLHLSNLLILFAFWLVLVVVSCSTIQIQVHGDRMGSILCVQVRNQTSWVELYLTEL